MGSSNNVNGVTPALRHIPLSYVPADSQASALRLILTLNPDWEGPGNKIEFVRFTDGITNTVCLSTRASPRQAAKPFKPALLTDSTAQLLKIINRKSGLTDEQIDNEAVLMRAYGNGTEILIDRESTNFQDLPPNPPNYYPICASAAQCDLLLKVDLVCHRRNHLSCAPRQPRPRSSPPRPF